MKRDSSASKPKGSGETFTDERDGKVYGFVKIGDQVWMAENLNYESADSFCRDTITNCAKFGRYYLQSDVAQGVCPKGWHLPDTTEWKTLFSAVGGQSTAALALKSTTGWKDFYDFGELAHLGNGNDSYGFSVLPAGYKDYVNMVQNVGVSADFWTSCENSPLVNFSYASDEIFWSGLANKSLGFSVRCLKD